MYFRSTMISVLLFTYLSSAAYAKEEVTPSHVYSRALVIKQVIDTLSKNSKSNISPIELADAQPLHVYAITTALNEKLAILNVLAGLPSIQPPAHPGEEIQPKHVLKLMNLVQRNLQMLVPDIKFRKKDVVGKRPADVLRILVSCHLSLDKLIEEQLTPKYPFLLVSQLKEVLTHAIEQTGHPVPKIPIHLYQGVKPKDVLVYAENMLKTLMGIAHLKYDVEYPSRPYYTPHDGKYTQPLHVFTVSSMNIVLLKDFIRRQGLQAHIGSREGATLVTGTDITPAHVYALYEEVLYLTSYFIIHTRGD